MKNIIFDLGGVVVEWNAKRVIETFKGNPILVNFVRENRLFLNDWREKVYDPMKPIISGWDFNVAPYMSEMELQINYEKKEIYLLEENLGKPENKENNTPKLSQKIRDKHLQNQHIGGIIITGDPAGLKKENKNERYSNPV